MPCVDGAIPLSPVVHLTLNTGPPIGLGSYERFACSSAVFAIE